MERMKCRANPRKKGYARVSHTFLELAKNLSERKDGNDILDRTNLDKKELVVFLFRGLCDPPQTRAAIADAIGTNVSEVSKMETEAMYVLNLKIKEANANNMRNMRTKDRRMKEPTEQELAEKNLFTAVIAREMDAIVKALVKGASINATDHYGKTPLILACEENYTDIAKFLVKEGARVDIQCQNGMDAMRYAILHDNKELMEILRRAGAEIMPDAKGYTRTMKAAEEGNNFVLKLFVEIEEINKKNKDGDTALMLAAKNGNSLSVLILRAAGADIYITNKGMTARDYAERNNHKTTAKLLYGKIPYGVFCSVMDDDELVEMAKKTADSREELTVKDHVLSKEIKRRERDLLTEAYGPPKN